jgi:hypothetical protein
MLGFTIVLLFAVVLLLTGLGVFGVPDANDFRDWDSYYEKRDALDAEWDRLFWESRKLRREIEPFISRDFDNPNSFIETPEERAAMKVLTNKLKGQLSKSKALQRKANKLDRQYPPELVSKYAGYPRYDR